MTTCAKNNVSKMDNDPHNCSICLTAISPVFFVETACCHTFHYNCWNHYLLKKIESNATNAICMLNCPLCKKELLDFHATFTSAAEKKQKRNNPHLFTAFANAYSVRLENAINLELDMDFFSVLYSQIRYPLENVAMDSAVGVFIENPNPIHTQFALQRAHAQYQLLLNRRRLQEIQEESKQDERSSFRIHKKDFCCIS